MGLYEVDVLLEDDLGPPFLGLFLQIEVGDERRHVVGHCGECRPDDLLAIAVVSLRNLAAEEVVVDLELFGLFIGEVEHRMFAHEDDEGDAVVELLDDIVEQLLGNEEADALQVGACLVVDHDLSLADDDGIARAYAAFFCP